MRLVKTIVEALASTITHGYTPFPLEHKCRGNYAKWEPRRVIEFKYEASKNS